MDASVQLMQECTNGPAFILTTPWVEGGKTYNAAILADQGKILGITFKNNLPNYGVFDEKRIFSSGPLPEPITFKGHKLGIVICEDIWFEPACAHLKQQKAEIILSPNGSPYSTKKRAMRDDVIRARVKETGLPLLYVNQVGGQDDLVYDGGSMAYDASGQKIFQAPYNQSYIGAVEGIPEEPSDDAAIYDCLKLALKDYIQKNNFPGIIIGMSGGIDSALSAAIAVDALGADKVRCVMLPSPFTSKDSFEDAEACCKKLGCFYEVISIEPAMKAFENSIPNLSGLAHENMQSRARGIVLMSLSNQTGWMVLTTGNKSEMATGYATLYGDMCGGFNVLKDIYKMKVYELSKWRNAQSLVIPERIITKAPTAELRDNQTDQDSLPPYEILDAILEGLIEQDLGIDDLVKKGFKRDTVQKVNRLLDIAEYKRRQSAPGPKITPRAFGRDRRWPITNGFRGD
ncbi:MAG: NAD+ synthase [Micavibrio aeruginosavorus]|uniref:Glutamine-dependent NAD(+) synthetase n=1 Tax=Micavibrio aeruginosavorus TaxID=349221 RepID=A0A2W5MR77_9BACT|nr:MAG: NAD+ synthase [Micavibrio aeruginosavorus]